MILGVDISKYQYPVDFELMKISFTILKLSQGDYLKDKYVEEYYPKIKTEKKGFYHWFDPLIDVNRQYDYIMKSMGDKKVNFLALDVEQYWASWGEWSNGAVTKVIPSFKIAEYSRRLAVKLSNNIKVIIYTSPYFIWDHCIEMKYWLNNFPYWYASYPYKKGTVKINWEDLEIEPYTPIGKKISYPKKFMEELKNPLIWQFSGDKFILPGTKSRIDLNLCTDFDNL